MSAFLSTKCPSGRKKSILAVVGLMQKGVVCECRENEYTLHKIAIGTRFCAFWC